MKSYSPREVMKILEDNGWKLERIKGDHYIYKKENVKYKAVLPISKKDIRIGVIKDIERKTGIKFE